MSFVVSAGTIVDLDGSRTPTSWAAPSWSLLVSDLVYRDYEEIWRKQPEVRSVGGFVVRNMAQLGLHLYRRISDEDRVRVTDHPVARWLRHPNPADRRMTQYRFVHTIIQDLVVYDVAAAIKVKMPNGSIGTVRWSPRRIRPIGKSPLWPEAFELQGTKGKRELPADQVIFWQGSIGLVDPLWGMPPLETLRVLLQEEYEASQMRQELWRNGARVSGTLEHPGNLSEPAQKRLRAYWDQVYTRGGSRSGGTPILEEGMKFNPGQVMTARDAQYIEARKLHREEVAAAFHVPPAMVGINQTATYASLREQHQMLYQDTLGPWVQMFQQDLNAQVLSDFADEDLYIEFNVEEKLRGNFEAQADALQASVGAPWMTRNEARALRNLPAVDGGDDLITPLNVLIGGQANPQDSAPGLAASTAAEAKRHLERWSDLLRRGTSFQPDRFVRELAADLPEDAKSVAAFMAARITAGDPATEIQSLLADIA